MCALRTPHLPLVVRVEGCQAHKAAVADKHGRARGAQVQRAVVAAWHEHARARSYQLRTARGTRARWIACRQRQDWELQGPSVAARSGAEGQKVKTAWAPFEYARDAGAQGLLSCESRQLDLMDLTVRGLNCLPSGLTIW